MQREGTNAKGTCFPWECQVLAVALEGGSTAVLWADKGGIPAALGLWLLPPSQCRAPLSFLEVCLTVGGELQSEGSVFILVQSPSWVALQAEKSFSTFYFSLFPTGVSFFLVSFVVLSLFEANLVSMRSRWDFVALSSPLPGMRDYCFLLEKCNQCSAWRPGHCVWPFALVTDPHFIQTHW